MEVVVPVQEFHFHTAMNTPYISAPSSPQKLAPWSPPNRFTNNSSFFESHHHRHVSAPNSPTSSAAIYAAIRGSRHSSIPFDWEEKPGTPKSPSFEEKDDDFDFDFAFAFGDRQIEKPAQPPPEATSVVAADELFELGMIRPLKPPPRLYAPVMGEQGLKSPKSGGLLSPLRRGRNPRGKELDPFFVAMLEATKSQRGSRSLSPFGGRGKGGSFQTPASSPPRNPPPMAEKGGQSWKCWLKELLLFRSSSLGRVTGERKKNDLFKFGSSPSSSSASSASSAGSTKGKTGFGGGGEESRSSSFRSGESGSTRRGGVTPQEMECTKNKTAAVMEKKMVAPYKQSRLNIRSFTAGKFGTSFIRRRT